MKKRQIFDLYHNKEIGRGWFKCFSFQIHWKDSTRCKLSFSERNGFKKYYKIGKWIVTIAKQPK